MPVPEYVVCETTKNVISQTTSHPTEEVNRFYAWQHLTTPELPGPEVWTGELAHLASALTPSGKLGEIAKKYDQATRRIELDAADEVSDTDLLAGLLVIRALREKLVTDERRFIAEARRRRITWARLASAMELGSRQAAERRYLQLRTDLDELAGSRLTQSERVEHARDQRDRRSERAWAIKHAHEIRALAHRLLAVPDLQERADRSANAQKSNERSLRDAEAAGLPAPSPQQMPWPRRLRETVSADEALQQAPRSSGRHEGRLEATRVANVIYRLIGLLRYAADPAFIDLADHPDLATSARRLCSQAGLPALDEVSAALLGTGPSPQPE
ncbi:hypothetical protein [Streptomyces sp. NPDC001820]|uniref:hypothetical protein n=1 Tax=Streptomyces sp. NPDC001820 TaxID=3364613 RepID=UPI003687FD50